MRRHLRGRIALQANLSLPPTMRVCRNAHFGFTPRRCVRMAKMQGAEDEGAGSVLKYMTKPESDSNEADWLL